MYHMLTDNRAVPALIVTLTGVPNAAGSGAGAAVTTAVTVNNGKLPANLPGSLHFNVHVTPSQPAFVTITGKTINGFNVVLTPPAGVTLGAGSFDVSVFA